MTIKTVILTTVLAFGCAAVWGAEADTTPPSTPCS